METVTLAAKVVQKDDGFVATIEILELTGEGATAEGAQDDLVGKFMSWVQTCEGQGNLETTLTAAGYTDVDEDTELELQFEE